jgi:hypothetical protein
MDRNYRESRDAIWAKSDVVFVGQVLNMRATENTIEVTVRPRGALKGEVGTEPIVYLMDYDLLTCGVLSFPNMKAPGVFYATRDPNGQLVVDGMVNEEDIRDQALFDRLYEQLGWETVQLGPTYDESLPPVQPYWAWLAGTAGFSLFAGILIASLRRRAPKKQKPRL